MFGYITCNPGALDDDARREYRMYYCGMCHALYDKYGQKSRLTLSNDLTFLAVLLSSLYEPDRQYKKTRCPIHPLRDGTHLKSAAIDYAADMNILLTHFVLEDHILDDRSLRDRLYSHALKDAVQDVKERYPDKFRQIADLADQLHVLEAQEKADLDSLIRASGRILGTVFRYREDVWGDALQHLGTCLGEFVYLMDAYDDYESDKRKKRFNPLNGLYGQEGFGEFMQNSLQLLASGAAETMESLPLEDGIVLIRNVLYSGIWFRYHQLNHRRSVKEPMDDT